MSLLFDNNLSPRLVDALADVFPTSTHVAEVGLIRADDAEIWTYARDYGLTIVTKDADFNDLVILHGPPPRVVWLRIGNCTTAQVELLIRSSLEQIKELASDSSSGLLSIL